MFKCLVAFNLNYKITVVIGSSIYIIWFVASNASIYKYLHSLTNLITAHREYYFYGTTHLWCLKHTCKLVLCNSDLDKVSNANYVIYIS